MKRFLVIINILLLFPVNFIFSQDNQTPDTYPPKAILNAAYIGDVDLLQKILATNPDRDVRDSLGGTALHVAVLQNNLDIIKILIENGFDVNATVPVTGYQMVRGYTPLHYCVWTNNVDAARLLLQYKADKNIKALDGMTPVEKATKEGKRDLLLLFAKY
ncbi:MAG: ankyrin repeat domain-containing protein [Treponema sp.]|nr:ankyrin repeat domain-containing protein [Treponema sp.]